MRPYKNLKVCCSAGIYPCRRKTCLRDIESAVSKPYTLNFTVKPIQKKFIFTKTAQAEAPLRPVPSSKEYIVIRFQIMLICFQLNLHHYPSYPLFGVAVFGGELTDVVAVVVVSYLLGYVLPAQHFDR